jgi:hypothetical protein
MFMVNLQSLVSSFAENFHLQLPDPSSSFQLRPGRTQRQEYSDKLPDCLSGVPSTVCWKNPILNLILGGAAVHRCDNRLVFSAGFSR